MSHKEKIMKINENRGLLIATTIMFTIASGLMARADEKSDAENEKRGSRYERTYVKNWDEPQTREASSLSFLNNTNYNITVYATVRKKGQCNYEKARVELGTVLANKMTSKFPGLKDNFIGRANTRYWIKVAGAREGFPAIHPEPFQDKLTFEGVENSSDALTFKQIGQTAKDPVKMSLNIKQPKGSTMEMVLSYADKK